MTREEALKDFHRRRLAAQDALRCDPELSGSDAKVGAELFSRVDFRTGEVMPISEARMAEKLHLGARTVKRAIANLKKAGWIEVVKFGRANRYRPVFDCAERRAQQGPNWPLSNAEQGPNWPVSDGDRGQKGQEQGPKSAENRGQIGTPLPLENPLPLPAGEETGAVGAAPDGAAGPTFDLGLPGVRLRERLGDAAFRSWLGNVAVVSIGLEELVLQAPTKFIAQRLVNDFEGAILDAWRIVRPGLMRVRVIAAAARPEHPDARWLVDIGIELVADLIGEKRDVAAEELKAWLRLCHDNPTVLREIIVGAARFSLQGDRFRSRVREAARAAPQGQLKFGPEDRLKKRRAS